MSGQTTHIVFFTSVVYVLVFYHVNGHSCLIQQGVWLDFLHTFLLGLMPDAIASALSILTADRLCWPSKNRAQRLLQSYADYIAFCRGRKIQDIAPRSILNKLKTPKNKKKAYPTLSQRNCKGSFLFDKNLWFI